MSESQSEPGDETRRGWRERVYGIRSVAAVAVAGLIMGGGAGVVIHAAVGDDEGGRDGRGRMGQGPGGVGGPGGQMPGQGQGQGQAPGRLPPPPGAGR